MPGFVVPGENEELPPGGLDKFPGLEVEFLMFEPCRTSFSATPQKRGLEGVSF